MENTDVKVNSMKAWVLAARPKTLSGAAVPVMIGVALAMADTDLAEAWAAAASAVKSRTGLIISLL